MQQRILAHLSSCIDENQKAYYDRSGRAARFNECAANCYDPLTQLNGAHEHEREHMLCITIRSKYARMSPALVSSVVLH